MERPDEIALAKRIEAGLLAQELLDRGGDPSPTPPGCGPQEALSPPVASSREELAWLVAEGRSARDELIAAHLGLVGTIAGEVARRRRLPFDDLFQEGCLALQEAVMRYDWRKGALGPYAAIWIRVVVRRYRAQNWQPIDQLDLEDRSIQDRLDRIDDRVALTAVLAYAPEQVARILKLRCGWEGKPQTRQQVGLSLGLTPATVRQIERDGLRQIRRQWGLPGGG